MKATKPLEEMVSPETPNSAIKQVIRNLVPILMGSHEHISIGSIWGILSVIKTRFLIHLNSENKSYRFRMVTIFNYAFHLGCALTFASEAKFEIEAKISFRLEAKKKPDFT